VRRAGARAKAHTTLTKQRNADRRNGKATQREDRRKTHRCADSDDEITGEHVLASDSVRYIQSGQKLGHVLWAVGVFFDDPKEARAQVHDAKGGQEREEHTKGFMRNGEGALQEADGIPQVHNFQDFGHFEQTEGLEQANELEILRCGFEAIGEGIGGLAIL
jgi:hypothetical protein